MSSEELRSRERKKIEKWKSRAISRIWTLSGSKMPSVESYALKFKSRLNLLRAGARLQRRDGGTVTSLGQLKR